MNRIVGILISVVFLAGTASSAFAAEQEKIDNEKAYYGTVIAIDPNAKTLKLITNDGVMVDLVAEDKAAKHLDKIPLNSLIDVKVEMRDGAPALVKSWKMAQAQSPCRVFDGRMCTP
ncbi:MAG TPA: hypothetical protein VGJ57_00540 [Nitrospirales bacterium]|jgi:hypothetical protein